jgi:hypothetical protein
MCPYQKTTTCSAAKQDRPRVDVLRGDLIDSVLASPVQEIASNQACRLWQSDYNLSKNARYRLVGPKPMYASVDLYTASTRLVVVTEYRDAVVTHVTHVTHRVTVQ